MITASFWGNARYLPGIASDGVLLDALRSGYCELTGSWVGNWAVDCMEERLTTIEVDVAVLKTDSGYIRRDVAELRTGIQGFRVHQERDFRLLFGGLIFVALSLAGLMAKGFGWLH